MNRRDFLAASGLNLIGLTLAWWPGNTDCAKPAHEGLTEALAQDENACAVGRCYLEHHPEEANWQLLTSAVYGRACDEPMSGGRDTLTNQLVCRITADFEEERVVYLEGWMLAVTEARLCAMAALI